VRRAVFVDRDGVLNDLVRDPVSGRPESPLDPEHVVLLPGVAAAVRRLHDAGYLVIGISNQPAAAKGIVGIERLEQVQSRVLELLGRDGVTLDCFRLCFHHPEGIVPELARQCECRKPRAGMLLEAANELDVDLASSWMVGDTDGDVAAGCSAGCRTVLIENPASLHKRRGDARPDACAPDLSGAADLIASRARR